MSYNLAHQNRTIAIASDFRVDRSQIARNPTERRDFWLGKRKRKSLVTFHRALQSQCSIALTCLQSGIRPANHRGAKREIPGSALEIGPGQKPINKETHKQNFPGLSRDYPGTVPGLSRDCPEISWEFCLCVSLFPQEKGKHINNLTPTHFRDNPAKLFIWRVPNPPGANTLVAARGLGGLRSLV